jgi:hypothetical protein
VLAFGAVDASGTNSWSRLLLACGLVAAIGACGDELLGPECSTALRWGRGGEYMLPGSDCLDCHRERGSAAASSYTFAGTIFARPDCPIPVDDAIVRVVDSDGASVTMISNGEGNFFSEEELAGPFTFVVEVDGVTSTMLYPVDSGSCGRCHAADSDLGFVFVGD